MTKLRHKHSFSNSSTRHQRLLRRSLYFFKTVLLGNLLSIVNSCFSTFICARYFHLHPQSITLSHYVDSCSCCLLATYRYNLGPGFSTCLFSSEIGIDFEVFHIIKPQLHKTFLGVWRVIKGLSGTWGPKDLWSFKGLKKSLRSQETLRVFWSPRS